MSFEEQLIQLNHQTTFPMKLSAQGPDAGGFSFQWSQMSSGGNEAFDPAGEFGDTRVNPVIIRASAASAPAHHTGQKPASRRLLTHQRPARVALTEKHTHACNPAAYTHHQGYSIWSRWSPDRRPSLRCDTRRRSFWAWSCNHRNAHRHLHWPIARLLSAEHHWPLLDDGDRKMGSFKPLIMSRVWQ